MSRVYCCTCGKPGEIKEMAACPACGQHVCRECERRYDGYCAGCLNAESDMTLL